MILQQRNLSLEAFDLFPTSVLELMAELGEILDGLFVFLSLSHDFSLVLANLLPIQLDL